MRREQISSPFDTERGAFVSNCVLHGDPNLMLDPKLIDNAPAPSSLARPILYCIYIFINRETHCVTFPSFPNAVP